MPAVTCAVLHWFLYLPVGDHCNWLPRVIGRTQPNVARKVIYTANNYVRDTQEWSVTMYETLCTGYSRKSTGRGPGPPAAYTLGFCLCRVKHNISNS
jgi:hypothetical protein